jgi:predicted O-linked N-acetylglucosamine transferase (SPINDLY family)
VELANLRQRVKRQRAEIRRLNQSASFWNGHRFATAKTLEATLRGKMIAAFGVEAVRQAESGKK